MTEPAPGKAASLLCRLESASVSYADSPALQDVTLELVEGERIALIGRSGAGKSTLLKLIFERAQGDRALVPQDFGLVRSLSVFHNVYSGRLRNHNALYNLANLLRPFPSEVEAVMRLLVELGLEDKLFERAGELSGGQQQRCAVARALYQGSPTLLADEPVSAVDERQSRTVLDAICAHHDSVILSMHDVSLALDYADRVIGLRDGRVTLDTSARGLSASSLTELYVD